ncbi:ABC transporter ATP-binding protein [Mangrovibacterium diazotrophicum]|uniref:ATP-binding cassette subfamily B protein n=1 Tax=Mangrovibacterium diazotrophicum TaxID=1261403 RepID=A0A419W800_9BACT|nr:ABC transporter ATP-binding protein [Mangrovibacterium diazotrophicum]RKD91589.1 ATP-binding cassette subfamily B protein [Mangrovibacterium diazotrophicum]
MFSKLKFVFKYTHQYRWWYTGGIIFLALTVWASITIPEFIQKTIDLIAAGKAGNESEFQRNVLIIVGLAVTLILVRSLSRILIFVPARLIERNLKGEMFKKLASFPKAYYDENSTGSIISRINNDINGVRMITGFGILQIVNIILSLSLTPYKMWQLSPALTLYCVIPMVVIFVTVRVGMAVMVKYTHLRMGTLQSLSGKTISFLSGNAVIKSFNIYNYAEEEVQHDNLKLFDEGMKISWIRSFIMPLLANLGQILKILVLLVGGLYVIDAKFTIGELTAYIAYAALLAQPIMGLGWVLTIFQQGMVGIDSIQTILSRKGADDERQSLVKEEKEKLFESEIKFENLSYTFHNAEKPALENISFTIKPGQIIGVTGQVGAGKTTLINCLNGYLRPEKGMIYFGKKDAAEMKSEDIRSVVRTVSQEVFLFSDTIENNVAFGSEKAATKNEFDEVIFKSAFREELARFGQKEKTLVGEKGIMLSGGQKQRLSLARALYTPCELLILDDVFSAVDTDTERFLIKQIVENNAAKSLVIVSNRISVLEKTDYTIVLEDGRMAAQGRPDELLKTSDFYREIAQLQKEK